MKEGKYEYRSNKKNLMNIYIYHSCYMYKYYT